MKEPLIPGGYILLSRKIIESEIWDKPPLYIKVWVYLLSKAQHQDYKQLKRGQLWTSIPEIQEACSWYVGFRKETPSKDQIYRIIDWLRKSHEQADEEDTTTSMITTTKATQGLLVKIVNYNVYQTSENYERNKERGNEKDMNTTRPQQHRDNINKNDKNVKNDKKDIYILSDDENKFLNTLEEIENYPLDRKKDLEMYKTLEEKYPTLNLVEAIEQWRIYKLDQPLKAKSNPRSQISTAFKKYVDWGKCLKNTNSSNFRTDSNPSSWRGSDKRL